MTRLTIDKKKLADFLEGNRQLPATDRLYRDGYVLFIGGALPLYQTLETMFNSFCTEATSLFYLTLGSQETLAQSLEMARQIKKNFHIRLMARLESPIVGPALEQIYAAGVDNLDLLLSEGANAKMPESIEGIFPRWGVASTISLGEEDAALTLERIDSLIQRGIVPLVRVSSKAAWLSAEQIENVLQYLVDGWERNSVPLQAYLPLISSMTPLVQVKPAGVIRGLVERLRDRQQLVGSDIRRHLRVQPAENSLDSAGL
jgi:hypothetical protein